MKHRIRNMAVAADQFVWNWATLGRYDPDMTLSAIAYEWSLLGKRHWPMRAIDWLFSPLESDHCRKAFFSERRCYV